MHSSPLASLCISVSPANVLLSEVFNVPHEDIPPVALGLGFTNTEFTIKKKSITNFIATYLPEPLDNSDPIDSFIRKEEASAS